MGSTANRLKAGVRSFYHTRGIALDTPQIIALSGGADSVALLYILGEVLRMAGVSPACLTAAYYNHHLRPEGELAREMGLISELTGRWGVGLVIGEEKGEGLLRRAEREKRSLEDTAREARYAFLEGVREERGAPFLVLAHHGGDQAETMVTRFFQGSRLSGLSGIRPVQGNRLRPLLPFPKETLVRCLVEEGIPWSEDSTNGDGEILRNSLRGGLLKSIAGEFPGYESTLSALAEKISRYDRFLEGLGRSQPWRREGDRLCLNLDLFLDLDPAVREYTLYYAIDELLAGSRLSGGKGRRFPYRFLLPLLENRPLDCLPLRGHGLFIDRERDSLVIGRIQLPVR